MAQKSIIEVSTKSKTDWIDITKAVQEQVESSGIKEGIAVVYVPHTTAGITINEHADPAVVADINDKLADLIPADRSYSHTEGNSDGHIKASLIGTSQTIFISNKELELGTWQGIFFCEFDGPRNRKVYVKVLGN
ncbi:MAG: YjbQ family protein [Actinobacteria bacterium]|nr:MAG: YjbQ family protein [Actinomycetota bacterium]